MERTDKNANAPQGRSRDFKRHSKHFTDGALNSLLKAPRRCFSLIFCPLGVCKTINSVLCYLRDQGKTKIKFRLHRGQQGSSCFVHGPISKEPVQHWGSIWVCSMHVGKFLSWRLNFKKFPVTHPVAESPRNEAIVESHQHWFSSSWARSFQRTRIFTVLILVTSCIALWFPVILGAPSVWNESLLKKTFSPTIHISYPTPP